MCHSESNVDYVCNDGCFKLSDQTQNEALFVSDKLHPSYPGSTKLMKNLDVMKVSRGLLIPTTELICITVILISSRFAEEVHHLWSHTHGAGCTVVTYDLKNILVMASIVHQTVSCVVAPIIQSPTVLEETVPVTNADPQSITPAGVPFSTDEPAVRP